jgi:hypothetical protein
MSRMATSSQPSSFTAVPRPVARAFSYTATAAATSWSAVPELSKIVISSSRVRPRAAAGHDLRELGVDLFPPEEVCGQRTM